MNAAAAIFGKTGRYWRPQLIPQARVGVEPPRLTLHGRDAQVEDFMPCLPVISGLRTPGMRGRHWDQISESLGVDLHPDESYTLTM